MDSGYPQNTNTDILGDLILLESNKLEKEMIVSCTTEAISWRKPGISYNKNEIYLDIVEKVNFLVDSKGKTLSCRVLGEIKAKSQLSNMPVLELGLNDKAKFDGSPSASGLVVDDVKFHQCVNLTAFNQRNEIQFTPPDGDFTLVSYRLNKNVVI